MEPKTKTLLKKYFTNPEEIWTAGLNRFLEQNPEHQHIAVSHVVLQVEEHINFLLGKNKRAKNHRYIEETGVPHSKAPE